ncbi:MBL fold metallo-hydrolase [Amycolatopsis magusensis]|uniref:MBL fold metallo-hydrolase n=1 Tax=Amycolatopsis magusensis TaxID=882444 RepID=UPI003C301FA1
MKCCARWWCGERRAADLARRHRRAPTRRGPVRARAAAPRRPGTVGDDPPGQAFRKTGDGERIAVAGTELEVLHTPGHSPGSICLHLPEAQALFSGGPGATGRSFSHFPAIIGSIRDRVLELPEETRVHTGHGDGTTVGTEAPHLSDWIARGY